MNKDFLPALLDGMLVFAVLERVLRSYDGRRAGLKPLPLSGNTLL